VEGKAGGEDNGIEERKRSGKEERKGNEGMVRGRGETAIMTRPLKRPNTEAKET